MRGRVSAQWRLILGLAALQIIAACTGSSNVDVALTNPTFPALAGEASGKDAQSGSTNFSEKLFDPSQKADPLAGAGYIQIPQMNNYGGVSFSYPIEIPRGRAGLEPKISLSYSSSGGDGWLGIGWNLGLGAITRTTQYGQLFYDKRDAFTYGGKRLIKVQGPSNSENGVYRLEIEDGSFARLELTGVETGGVWTVFDKSGTRTFYGENLSERIYVPGSANKTYSWNFTRTVDLNGNFLTATYDDSLYAANHVLYLKEIRYTGNEQVGFSAYQYVRFNLKSRGDAYVSRAPGFAMKVDRLVDTIEVGWQNPSGGEEPLWSYTMEYITSADSNRPLIERIRSSRTATHPKFTYQPAAHTLGWNQVNNVFAADPEINPKSTQYLEGDFNGDGKSDFCFFNPENGLWKVVASSHAGAYLFQTWGSRFMGFKGETKIQWFKGNVTGDYNGDGKSDIAFYLPESKEFWVAESTGVNFNFRLYGKFTLTQFDLFKAEWFTGDYDGNGLSDVILFDEPTGDWILMRNKGGYFTFQKIGKAFQHLYRKDFSAGIGNNSPATNDNSAEGQSRGKVHWLSGDFNGDGRSDYSFYDERDGKWWVGTVGVTGSMLQVQSCIDNPLDCTPSVDWKLYKVFTAPEQTLFGHDRFSGDFNGDGLSDFLLFDRETGKFWLGETKESFTGGNPTIDFRIFATAPQFKDITRWLQGDFNGDGRTDIGFYSKTDGNFWIGEASPAGFRFRIYSNLNGGPDANRVIAAAPLPKDEIVVKEAVVNFAQANNRTARTKIAFDGNTSPPSPLSTSGEGGTREVPFLGCFTATSCAGDDDLSLLVYNRKDGKFRLKKNNEAIVEVLPYAVDGESTRFLSQPRPFAVVGSRFKVSSSGKEGVLVYENGASGKIIKYVEHTGGNVFSATPIATMADSLGQKVTNFDIDESAYLISDFYTPGAKNVMVFDDQEATGARFVFHNDANTRTNLNITGPANIVGAAGVIKKDMFKVGTGAANRSDRKRFRFFAGKFTSASAQILIVDMRNTPHRYFLGTVGASAIDFVELTASGDVTLPQDGSEEMPEFGNAISLAGFANEQVVYATRPNGQIQFHRLNITAANIALIHYSPLAADFTFAWETDHLGRFLLTNGSGLTAVNLTDTAYTLAAVQASDTSFVDLAIDRTDLYNSIYAFQWLQGDYNGDGKTDIGFFHMKEPKWYFANTSGTVPDLVGQVDNGIGGQYLFTYANSSSFDNTGGDGISDLPMNYKVCTQLTVRDGFGGEYINTYQYKNGFAFSTFINGRKETDFFGFSEFITTDAMGSKTINHYNTTLYGTSTFDQIMLNRALAGALKDSTFNGWDAHEYSRTLNTYQIFTIAPPGVDKTYLVGPLTTEKYIQGVKTQTTTKGFQVSGSEYKVDKITESVTDHYTDAARAAETITSEQNFFTDQTTNQQREVSGLRFKGTGNEVTTFTNYDSRGNVSQTIQRYTGANSAMAVPDRVMEFQYDGFGNRVAQTNVSATPTRRTETVYDDKLQQYVAQERMLGDSVVLTQTMEYDFAFGFGKPKSVANPNNRKRYFTYDAFGRVIKVEADTETVVQTLSEYVYSAVGDDAAQLPLSAKTIQYSGSGAADVSTRVFKDGVGRELHSVQSATAISGKRYTKTGKRTYDALGRVIRQSQPAWALDDEIDRFQVQGSELNPTVTEYDASGRVKKITSPPAFAGEPETSVTTTYNDPYEVVTVHAAGQGKRTRTNGRGYQLYVEDFSSTALGAPNDISAKMYFCYDIAGNRVKRSDTSASLSVPGDCAPPPDPLPTGGEGANVSRWKYDGLGQVTQVADPDTGLTTLTYTAFGQLQSKTDARSFQTSYFYDRLGRLTQKILPNGEGTVTMGYDTAPNGLGHLAAIEDASGRKAFAYDVLGRISEESRQIRQAGVLGAAYVTRMQYDLLDRSTLVQYPTDPKTSTSLTACYGYNNMGLVSSIKVAYSNTATSCSDKTIINNIEYNEFRQTTRMERGNGLHSIYTYDTKRRMTKMEYERSGSVIVVASYVYDIQDNITSAQINPTAAASATDYSNYKNEMQYEYDGLSRLAHAEGAVWRAETGSVAAIPFARNYTYANNGNLLTKQYVDRATGTINDTWSYTYSNHKVQQIFSTASGPRISAHYDDAGNMDIKTDTQGLSKTQAWDSYNRIASVTNTTTSDVVGTYTYDDGGFRVKKVSKQVLNSQTVLVELEAPNKYFGIEKQKDLSGTPIANTEYALNNVYLNGLRVASIVPGGAARWFMTDQLDSVNLVTNDTGAPVSHFEYLPFGEELLHEGDQALNAKYQSQERDKESQLYFFNARHYDDQLHRFVSADSIIDGEDDTQGWNRYSFVKNNPIVHSDPTGHEGKNQFSGGKEAMSRARMNMTPEEKKLEALGKEKAAEQKAYNAALSKAAANPKKVSKDYLNPHGNGDLKPGEMRLIKSSASSALGIGVEASSTVIYDSAGNQSVMNSIGQTYGVGGGPAVYMSPAMNLGKNIKPQDIEIKASWEMSALYGGVNLNFIGLTDKAKADKTKVLEKSVIPAGFIGTGIKVGTSASISSPNAEGNDRFSIGTRTDTNATHPEIKKR